MSKKRKALIWCLSITLVFAIIFGGCLVYLSIYYKADTETVDAFLSKSTVLVEENKKHTAFLPNEKSDVGFIFYPGGKVDYKAYYPLMQTLAEYGVFSVVVKMPFNLAVFDSNAADKVMEEYPDVKNWYIGGHSLGGAMAAAHTSKNEGNFKGLVLLGAYSTKNLSDSNISVLSVYGSLDKVMNKEKYDECLSNMPKDFSEFIIDGGCHAYFGAYGEQKGDGKATLSANEQIYITATHIYQFISSHG